MLTYNILNKYTEIAHFCTGREGGMSVGNYASFNLSPFSGDNPAHIEQNMQILAEKTGMNAEQFIIPYQTHGTEIKEIDTDFLLFPDSEKKSLLQGVDALITKTPNICLGITTADCVPVLFYDTRQKVIAAAHAGWRGTCNRIVEKTVLMFIEKFNSNPKDILVTLGPSISVKAYEVGKEVVENFRSAGFDISEIVSMENNSFYLDLWKANRISLEKAGILSKNIEVSGICTFNEHERYFSARRLGIKSGRMLSGIMLKS